jgi:tetratricopeptide (TPR) repeat protein
MKTGQVFISHTSDMAAIPPGRSFVQAALDAVGRAGMAPIDMRYFAAREGRPADYCRQRVRGCDIYVAVIGFRYGSMVPGEAVSYTELEFEEATAAGLSRLVFLLAETARPPADLADRGHGAVEEFRQRLRDAGLVIRVFTSDLGLELEVFHALTEEVAGRELPVMHLPADSELPAVPRQLPAAVPHFAGRSAELALLDLLAPASAVAGTVVISAINGTAGVGKTALALHWAHRVRAGFPDGDLYVNLRGYDPGPPLVPQQALDGLLRALGVPPERIPPEQDDQAALFRTLLSGRRMLLVLDNANSADQVRPLLPGSPGCLVIVTSRSQLSGLVARDDGRRIALDMLPPHEALALLRDIIGAGRVDAEPAAAAELASRCAYLPLALRIAAEHATGRPQATLAELASELVVGSDRLDALATADDDETTAVRAVFSWSYRQLTPPAARAFRLLGLHPGPDISTQAAAVLTGSWSESGTRRLLGMLAGAHLIEPGTPGRYRFHDLLRDYAAERAQADEPEEERTGAVHRVLAWYLEVAKATGQWLYVYSGGQQEAREPHGLSLPFATHDQALEWCQTELANLVSATRLAASAGEDEIAWQLPAALRAFFQLRMPLADWLATYEIGLAAARRLHDRVGEATVLSGLGGAYNYLGRYEEAINCFRQALDIHREAGLRHAEAMDLVNMGAIHDALRQFDEAISTLREAITVSRAAGNRISEGHALENLAAVYQNLQRHDEAVDCLHQSLTIFREVGRTYGEGLALARLASTYLSLGQYERAADYCQQSLAVQRRIGDRLGEAGALDTYAGILLATGRLTDARQAWQEALSILEDVSHPDASAVRVRLASLPG